MPPWEAWRAGLQARWGALCNFGVGDLRPGDGSRIVEAWPMRMARSMALSLGAWGLGTELRTRHRLWLWTTGHAGLWTTLSTAYTSSRISDDDKGS